MERTMSLISIPQLAEKHKALTEGSIRWRIFNAKQNGLEQSGAILRNGKRIFLDEDKFMNWLSGNLAEDTTSDSHAA